MTRFESRGADGRSEPRVTIEVQDRVVWVGDPDRRPVGSSGTVYEIDGNRAFVGWGGGPIKPDEWCWIGTMVVSCDEAGRRGIEPWATTHARRERAVKAEAEAVAAQREILLDLLAAFRGRRPLTATDIAEADVILDSFWTGGST